MKAGGPDKPGAPGNASGLLEPPRKAERGEGADFNKLLETGRAERTEHAEPAASSDTTAQIAARIDSGELSGSQAVEVLVEAAVRRQAALLGPELQQRLREHLRRLLEEDPLLAAKIKVLGSP